MVYDQNLFDSPWVQGGAVGVGALSDLYGAVNNSNARDQQRRIYESSIDPSRMASDAGKLMPNMSPEVMRIFQRALDANTSSRLGGATGGATQKIGADAWADRLSTDWFRALGVRQQGLQGASGAIPAQNPLGGLGGIMKALMALRQIRGGQDQQGYKGGLVDQATYQNMTDYQMPAVDSSAFMSP